MKQLTKEQHEAICEWLEDMKNHFSKVTFRKPEEAFKSYIDAFVRSFKKDFPPSCCDSCADGEHCESDIVRGDDESSESYMERIKQSK